MLQSFQGLLCPAAVAAAAFGGAHLRRHQGQVLSWDDLICVDVLQSESVN